MTLELVEESETLKRSKDRKYNRKYIEERFWKKVEKKDDDQCWNWKDYISVYGYGQFRFGENTIKAHRASYMINCGDIPEGLLVLHKCDNKKCVNPNHLFLGTPQDNMTDMVNKNRQAKAEDGSNSKLKWEQVNEIRDKYKQGNTTIYKLADKFNISHRNVSLIIRNETWKDANYNPIVREDMHGENNPFSKLTQNQVEDIRKLYETGGYTHNGLGKMFDVSRYTIMRIIYNRTYI